MEIECIECKGKQKKTYTYKDNKALNEHRAYMRRTNQGHNELQRRKSKTEIGDNEAEMEDVLFDPKKLIFELGDTGAFHRFN
jgi:hypothetical protein